MPAITSCPQCNKNLQVPDECLGKKVRCPSCKLGFIAQHGPGLMEVVDELMRRQTVSLRGDPRLTANAAPRARR